MFASDDKKIMEMFEYFRFERSSVNNIEIKSGWKLSNELIKASAQKRVFAMWMVYSLNWNFVS